MNHTEDFVIQDGILLEYIGDDSVVRVPDGVRGISWDAFREASPKELVLPEGLVWISDFAFSRLNSLRRLVLPGTLRTVPQGLCHQADNLEEVVIPEGVVCLSNMAFAETALPRVTIPDSVEVIGYACFQGCRHLEEVSLGRGIRYLAG